MTDRTGNWFERLFGFPETNRERVQRELEVHGTRLRAKGSGTSWVCGELEIASLADLRDRVRGLEVAGRRGLTMSELVGDAKALHADPAAVGATFQVASQFNLLEMVSPAVTPEQGITIYESDPTQGPACAMACAAGTLYRNYFVELDGQLGQTAGQQIDCLAAIGEQLENADNRLWRMRNGYALPTLAGLSEINERLRKMSDLDLDQLRSHLRIGLQWDTQVTLVGCEHVVTQAYCSALPVAYSGLPASTWERFARLILEAAYEATWAAAILNAEKTGNRTLYLTLLGGGAFGNDPRWILDAIHHAATRFRAFDLDVRIVSYRRSNPAIRDLCAAGFA
jgi:hypothetical protein